MWKYLAALLVVLLAMGGIVSAQIPGCADCNANIVTQNRYSNDRYCKTRTHDPDYTPSNTVAVGNEGLSAAIIVTQAPVNPTTEDQLFVPAPFARIDQSMDQTGYQPGKHWCKWRDGAKGVTWNKAIQAAWVANQGMKEFTGEPG